MAAGKLPIRHCRSLATPYRSCRPAGICDKLSRVPAQSRQKSLNRFGAQSGLCGRPLVTAVLLLIAPVVYVLAPLM
jgi:hypothetical protein